MQQQKIALLTGWGTSCQAWGRIIPALQQRYHVNCISPPWVTNATADSTLQDFDTYIDWLAEELQEPVTIIAWSFGGLVAIRLATRYPALVRRIVFISSSAKFVADRNKAGIDPLWFEKFKQDFSSRPAKLLQKFFMLTNHGDEFAAEATKYLKQTCMIDQYNMQECSFALSQLGMLDLAEQLPQLSCQATFIHGEFDAVLSLEAAQYAAQQAASDLYIIKSAGHAPHISHPIEVAEVISQVIPT